MILLWACLASALLWLSRRMREALRPVGGVAAASEPATLLLFSLRKLGPWLVAFLITLYLSVVLPDSLSKTLAMVMAYVLVCGTLFSRAVRDFPLAAQRPAPPARPGYPAAPGVPPVG